jgi:Glu-tRNA(Gln) amidotransferase subunit E-like FAD-binding protein
MKNLPKLKADILEELTKNISEEYAKMLIKENKIKQFNELGKSELAAKLLILYPKAVSSHEKIDIEKIEPLLNTGNLKKIISAVKDDRIAESSVKSVIIELIKGKDLEKIFQSLKPANKSDIEKEVKQVIKEKPGLTAGAYMGLLMDKLKGKVEGKELMQMIQKTLK